MEDYKEIFEQIKILDYMINNPREFLTPEEQGIKPSIPSRHLYAEKESYKYWVILREKLCQQLAALARNDFYVNTYSSPLERK